MFNQMDSLYSDLAEFYAFDKKKYTLEEFFGDVKSFKDSFVVNILFKFCLNNVLLGKKR